VTPLAELLADSSEIQAVRAPVKRLLAHGEASPDRVTAQLGDSGRPRRLGGALQGGTLMTLAATVGCDEAHPAPRAPARPRSSPRRTSSPSVARASQEWSRGSERFRASPVAGSQWEGRVEMLERVAMAWTVMLPILPIVGLLAWAEWRDRRRAALVARQIRLTDAIGAELGAVVAPVLRRGLGGAWRVDMTLPLGRPALVGRVLEITHRVLPGRYEIRLAPRMEPMASRRHPSAPIRPRGGDPTAPGEADPGRLLSPRIQTHGSLA
jgi:hypothetical protein